ncbi:MAG: von Willebrand factor type A domain-containing protein, partial [Atopobiaceae bacterium]|nr:von Willebrand factor type A domain-containing protein [Atopobiaceae bacterium]
MKRNVLRTSIALALSLAVVGCSLSPVPYEEPEPSAAPAPTSTEKSEQQTVSAVPEPTGSELEVMSDTAEEYAMSPDMYFAPEDYNTEEYASVEESGFVAAATTPLSTISADVDTASYANLRRMLRAGFKLSSAQKRDETNATTIETTGPEDAEVWDEYPGYYADSYQVIPAGAVRIEEMLNYFDYNYERPKTSDAFGMNAKVGPCPWNKDTQLLVLGFATGDEDSSVTEKGSNLVFLIDVSGSMDDADKLPLLQSSFGELVKSLGDKDRVSIVTYASGEEVVLEGAKGSDQQQIMRAIRGLKASGSTHGEAGLKMAYELARKNFIEGGVNRIVMASDGDLNVGMTSESDLHDYVDGQRKTGVYLSVLGFGAGNYKDTKMETLADHGNGSYHYIDCEAEAERVFGERLTANLVPFADDVKMQIEFNPSMVKGYRLIGYENRT